MIRKALTEEMSHFFSLRSHGRSRRNCVERSLQAQAYLNL